MGAGHLDGSWVFALQPTQRLARRAAFGSRPLRRAACRPRGFPSWRARCRTFTVLVHVGASGDGEPMFVLAISAAQIRLVVGLGDLRRAMSNRNEAHIGATRYLPFYSNPLSFTFAHHTQRSSLCSQTDVGRGHRKTRARRRQACGSVQRQYLVVAKGHARITPVCCALLLFEHFYMSGCAVRHRRSHDAATLAHLVFDPSFTDSKTSSTDSRRTVR